MNHLTTGIYKFLEFGEMFLNCIQIGIFAIQPVVSLMQGYTMIQLQDTFEDSDMHPIFQDTVIHLASAAAATTGCHALRYPAP